MVPYSPQRRCRYPIVYLRSADLMPGTFCAAYQSWQRALDCSDATTEGRSRVLTNLSLCLRQLGRLPEALAAAQKAIDVDSTWHKASTTLTQP